jgi:large subunit ribosomal protein L35
MPKMKTNKATAKRFRVKKSGKVRYKKAQLRHILTTKNSKRKRQKRPAAFVGTADREKFAVLLPYG